MKIAIAGASGFLGTYLTNHFAGQKYEMTLFVRKQFDTPHHISIWAPEHAVIDMDALKDQDVVINLAGRNLADGRWSREHKREIIESRVISTNLIARTISSLSKKPALFINASGAGYYGSKPDATPMDENSPAGKGFLAEVCVKWEQAAELAVRAGIRTVKLRTGIVFGEKGGALEKIVQPFKMGVGGKIGSGKQIMSWIALKEIGPIIDHLISTPTLEGGVNLATPKSVTNAEFTRVLGEVLHKSTMFTVPTFALKLAFGEMAEEMLLGGAAVIPRKLLESGYRFRYPDLLSVLKDSLG